MNQLKQKPNNYVQSLQMLVLQHVNITINNFRIGPENLIKLETIDIYRLNCLDILILVYINDKEVFYTKSRPFKQAVIGIVDYIRQKWKGKPSKITIKFKKLKDIRYLDQYLHID